MRRIVVLALLCGAFAVTTSAPLSAACISQTPLQHFESHFACADFFADRSGDPALRRAVPTQAYAWAVANPAINTGLVKLSCEQNGGDCNPLGQAGDLTDGQITIERDLSTTGIVGCPTENNPLSPRMALYVEAADGRSMIVSVLPDQLNAFTLELAHKYDQDFLTLPLSCGDASGARVLNLVSDGTNYNLGLQFQRPPVFTDCDADSIGVLAFGPCADGFVPNVGFGSVFYSHQPCDGQVQLALANWTNLGVTPAADGSATAVVPIPTAAGTCAYVGVQTMLNQQLSSGVTSSVRLAGQGAASDRALEVRAAKAQGKVTVSFRTGSELEAVSFDIVSGDRVVSKSPTAARGGNGIGASYEIVVGMGDLKGAKSLAVRTNLRGGGTITSDPVSF